MKAIEKRISSVLLGTFAGCAGTPGSAEDGTSGATSAVDDTAADPTRASASTTDPTDPTAQASSEDGSGPADGTTAGGPDDPSLLPFGGYVRWQIMDLYVDGEADFYTIEYPDDPAYEPWAWELPLGDPQAADEFVFELPPSPKMPVRPTVTDLAPGPRVDVTSDVVDLEMEFYADLGHWLPPVLMLMEPFAGGAFTVGMSGNGGEFPPETLPGIDVPGPAEANFQIVTDGTGRPIELVWTPMPGAQRVVLDVGATGPKGIPGTFCSGSLVDDGSAQLPWECTDREGLAGMDPSPYDNVFVVVGHEFHRDVAYAGYRLRLVAKSQTQINVEYPYVPSQ